MSPLESSFLGRLALVATVLTAQPGCDRKEVDGLCSSVREDLKACEKGQEAVNSAVEVDKRLTTFKADFDADPALKSEISWAEIQTRLLANEGHYLALAQAMEQGGQLFGVDADGRPLISDRGDEPVMKGMNYKDTHDRVWYKHDKDDTTGKILPGKDGKPQATGYEMFPYAGDYEKSPEISQYEIHTRKNFVQSPGKNGWRSSWLESEETASWPRVVDSYPNVTDSNVNDDNPRSENAGRGVRRLLRVEKA